METATWGAVLQNVTANAGPAVLPLGDYNFKVLLGRGQTASTGKEMVSCQLEVLDGVAAGRKTWHNWVLPDFTNGDPDKAQTSLSYFLGDMEVFGLTKDWFMQALGGQPINKATCDFIAQQLIGRTACATVTEQKSDKSRRNIGGWRAVDPTLASMNQPGMIPTAPQQGSPFMPQAAPATPQYGPPPMMPQGQPPQFQPGQMPTAPTSAPAYAPPPAAAPQYAPQASVAPPVAPQPGMMPVAQPQMPQAAPAPQGFPGGVPVTPPAVNF